MLAIAIDPERTARVVQPILERWGELIDAEGAFTEVTNGDLMVWSAVAYVEIVGALARDLMEEGGEMDVDAAFKMIDGLREGVMLAYRQGVRPALGHPGIHPRCGYVYPGSGARCGALYDDPVHTHTGETTAAVQHEWIAAHD